MLKVLLCAFGDKLLVTLECTAVEGHTLGASLFGMVCHVAGKDGRDLSVAAMGINLTRAGGDRGWRY